MRKRISKATRSYMMSQVRGKDTVPEKLVRSFLHNKGFRFRICCKGLPGRPDIVLKKHNVVIFVHGCFWHQHGVCGQKRTPKSNLKYWIPKLIENRLRDRRKRRALQRAGWKVLTIWECQIKKPGKVAAMIDKFIGIGKIQSQIQNNQIK
jgi:DNA mismatch endonuclease (patch repair protein)